MIFGKKKYKELTDEQLVEKYRESGKRKWMEVIFNRYAHLVYGSCLKYLKEEDRAKDEVMAIFEKLIPELKKQKINHFKSWLFMVCRNHCLMLLRKNGKEVRLEEDAVVIDESPSTAEHLAEEERLNQLEAAISRLKNNQEVCIRMFYLEKQSYAQIAEHTGMDIKSVKSHLQNGKRNLQILMNGNG